MMSRKLSVAAVIGVVLLLLMSYGSFAMINALDERDLQIGYAWMFAGLWWLVIAVLSATAIAQEKESDTWTVLLVSPLSGGQIVFGKLLGLLRRVSWPIVIVILHFSLFALGGVISWLGAALVVWVIVTFNAPWVATGLYLSLRLRNATAAVVFNLLIPVAIYGVAALLLGIVGAMFANTEKWLEVVAAYLPYTYLVISVTDISRTISPSNDTLWFPLIGYGNMSAKGFAQLTILVGVVHLGLVGAIVGYTILRFNRLVGRA
jgi:ABC-type transport system involved in multi-copper enzyme maturation permease subunit